MVMKRAVLLLLIILCLPQMLLAQETLDRAELNRLSNAVVQILTFEGDEPISSGSGIMVEATGLIYTNRHVIEDGTNFGILVLEDINELPVLTYFASLEGVSSDVDFAVLQIDRDIDGNDLDAQTLDLPFLTPTTPDVERGDPIFVFGYPGIGDGYLVYTQGTITTIQNGEVNDERLPIWYQTDAEIAPGNSGGLVVNSAGEMVGLPTIVQSEQNTGGRLAGILPISAALSAIEAGLDDALAVVASDTTNELDYRRNPAYGSVQLAAGFRPDPYSVSIISGGEIDASSVGGSCLGFAAPAPDFRLQWTGQSNELRIMFRAAITNADTTLIINTPSGAWVCNDDAANTTRNPLVILDNPAQGQYDIWVASYREGDYLDGTLLITELNQTPN